MKKTLILLLLAFSLTTLSACTQNSISRSKAKDAESTGTGTIVAENTDTPTSPAAELPDENLLAETPTTPEAVPVTTETTPPKTPVATETTSVTSTPTTTTSSSNELAVVSPFQSGNYTTGLTRNVIYGTASDDTYAIEINGFRLTKFTPGSQSWNYIASTQMETLTKGDNEYIVKAFDHAENVIDVFTFHINYQNGHTLPNVGSNLNIVFLLTFLFSLNLFIFRKNA